MSKLGSLLTTFVMAIPLAAVPFMAVYGIPELSVIAEKLAQARGEQESSTDPLSLETEAERTDPLASAPSWEDELSRAQPAAQFGGIENRAETENAQARVTPVNFAATSEARSSQLDPGRMQGRRPGLGSTYVGSDSNRLADTQTRSGNRLSQTNQRLTWQSATSRLNQLGIRNFRLEPGSTTNEYLFVCFFTPRENPNTTLRFEAEATEPLKAVEMVLQQIHQALAL